MQPSSRQSPMTNHQPPLSHPAIFANLRQQLLELVRTFRYKTHGQRVFSSRNWLGRIAFSRGSFPTFGHTTNEARDGKIRYARGVGRDHDGLRGTPGASRRDASTTEL